MVKPSKLRPHFVFSSCTGYGQLFCNEYERDMPTEMKLIYDVKSGNFKAVYKYDLVYTNDDIKTADHIADEWFDEVKI